MDRIMFGDNQFFGVNHMSDEKAHAQAMRFRNTEAILAVLDDAYDCGIRTFMCTTHDQISDVAAHVAAHPERYRGLKFHPGMPYAHKYANMVGELGMVETMRQVAPGGLFEAAARGMRSTLTKDLQHLMRILVDAEMVRFGVVETPVVFLQNVVADLLLGSGMHGLLAAFHEYVAERYQAEAGYFTMNMPRMVQALKSEGIVDPIICCNYNAIGFRMCGGIELYDRTLETEEVRCIAMSVLASGAIPVDHAVRWVCERPQIRSIVFGASSRSNIAQTVDLIERYSST
ncbi:hypothetical protein BH24ACT5_BH24ACT5_00120 [soil metagenome]